MKVIIDRITTNQIKELMTISRETFTDTFGSANDSQTLTQYLDSAYSALQLRSELNNADSTFWSITVDGVWAGYLKLNIGQAQSENFGDAALEIERIYVRRRFKRQGLGTKLYQLALNQAEQLGKTRIILGVWEHNEPAQKFYQRLGFHQIGAHTFQLGTDAQTDYIMEKKLTN